MAEFLGGGEESFGLHFGTRKSGQHFETIIRTTLAEFLGWSGERGRGGGELKKHSGYISKQEKPEQHFETIIRTTLAEFLGWSGERGRKEGVKNRLPSFVATFPRPTLATPISGLKIRRFKINI